MDHELELGYESFYLRKPEGFAWFQHSLVRRDEPAIDFLTHDPS